jgi:hypothetical protein
MIVNSPQLTISRGSATVAVSLGSEVTLVDVGDGSQRVVKAATTASIVALAPTGGHIPAVAGGFELSWLAGDPAGPVIQLPGQAMFVRLSDDGTVVVLTRSDSHGTRLCVYEGDDLAEAFEPVALGHSSANAVEFDSTGSVVMAGLNRTRTSDPGEPYLRQVEWAEGHASVTWGGDGMPNDVDLVRASAGHLVVLRGRQILTSSIAALAKNGISDGKSSDIDGEIETLAISPDGSSICIVVDGDDGLQVRSRSFGGARTADRGAVPAGVSAVAAAIGDDGTVVVTGLRSPTEALIAVAPPKGRLVERWQIDQPRSVFRDRS